MFCFGLGNAQGIFPAISYVCKNAFSQCEHDNFYAVLTPHIAELVPALREESSLRLFGHL